MKNIIAAFGVGAALMSGAASASDIGVAGDIGTTGVGLHVNIPLRHNLNARVGMGYLGYSYSGNTNGLDYDLSLKAKTYDALLDWFPSDNRNFRVTAGLAYNGNKIDAQARPNAAGYYTIQGNTYSAASVGKVTGTVDFGKVSPYLGIGWSKRSSKEKGWSFSTDVGVLFQGSPKATLANSDCNASAAVCNQFASDVAKENAALADEVHRFKVYPVLRIGINYRF